MPRIKNVNGVDIPFTQEEEDARDVEEAKWKAEKPMNDWLNSMNESDNSLIPRWGEDMIDRDGIEDLPQALIDKYNSKKSLRSTNPKE